MDVSPLAGLPAPGPAAAAAAAPAEPPAPPAGLAGPPAAGAEPGAPAGLAGAEALAAPGAGPEPVADAGAGALAAVAAPEPPAAADAGAEPPAEVAGAEPPAAAAGAEPPAAAAPAPEPPAAAAPVAAAAPAPAGAAEPKALAAVAPASKLQELFNTALFTNNNYIRIFELLNKKNIILIDNILVYKTNIDLYISYTTLNNLIKINNFYDIHNDAEKTNKIAKLKNIMNRIINEDIRNNIQNDIIVDPAGLDFVYNNFDGAGGLSRAIYNILTEKASLLPQFKLTGNKDNFLNDLFTININAGYKEYTDKRDTSGTTKINIIHSIGPNFSDFNNKKYLNYKTFKKIYDDIITVFKTKTETKSNNKLRLCALSSGLFAANYKDEIIYILALVFIELCINEPKENFDMYIIELDNGRKKDNQYLYNLFKYNVEYIVNNIIKLF